MPKITVGWMYPNLLNLHGERGSVQNLTLIAQKLGIELEIRRIEDFDDPIPFGELDLMMFLPGEIEEFKHIMPGLRSQEEGLRSYLENGGYLLAIGTTGLMFGNRILREDGSELECLGYLDLSAKERKYVYGDDLYVRMEDGMELIGSQIQMCDVEAAHPLAKVLYGMGNNRSGAEGARQGNLIYTNCLGPLFVKNPRFAEAILKDICRRKGEPIEAAGSYPRADASFEATKKFVATKMN